MPEPTAAQNSSTPPPAPSRAKKRLYALLATLVFAAAIVIVFQLARPGDNTKSASENPVAVVRITRTGFNPAMLTVRAGTKIIWINQDQGLHQVMANPYPTGRSLTSLKSEILNNQQQYGYLAKQPGTFGYHDQLNPTLNATLVVQKP